MCVTGCKRASMCIEYFILLWQERKKCRFSLRGGFFKMIVTINPIPTGCCHVTLICGLNPPMVGRNRVKWQGMHYDFGSVGAVCSIKESYGPQNQRVQKVCASTALTNSLDEKKNFLIFCWWSLSQDFCSCSCPGTKGQQEKKIGLSRDNGTSRPMETQMCSNFQLYNINNHIMEIQNIASCPDHFLVVNDQTLQNHV